MSELSSSNKNIIITTTQWDTTPMITSKWNMSLKYSYVKGIWADICKEGQIIIYLDMTNLSTTSNGKDQESPITIDEKDILGSIPQGIDMKLQKGRYKIMCKRYIRKDPS